MKSGGTLVVEALRRHGVQALFTLNGGHLFPVYEACVKEHVPLLDTRHELTAVFAAEGWAKLTRQPGVAAVTAGPGVTHAISALASARFNGSPLLLFGGRAPQARWGAGSLQEIDHLPLVTPLVKHAATVHQPAAIPAAIDRALRCSDQPHRGPVFLDVPLDVLFAQAEDPAAAPAPPAPDDGADRDGDPEQLARIAGLISRASAPVLVVGADTYWHRAEEELRRLVELAGLPCFGSGLGRGLLAPDHVLSFARARSLALGQADLVLALGLPLDFRLGFGRFPRAQVVHLADDPAGLAAHLPLAAAASGHLTRLLAHLAELLERQGSPPDRTPWLDRLRGEEQRQRQLDGALMASEADPIHPARIYGELRRRLDPDAVIIGDGGDFVSFAGRYLDTHRPGCFLDPGPFGCLGTGLGYAIAARLAHPGRQVVLLAGDGALGFSLMDFDTLVRFRLPVVIICGNNGIWGLEKHPMEMLYGFSAAADLQPACRYDQVAEALGGLGLLVQRPHEIGAAIDRALAAGGPTLINVLTDPRVAYPRSATLT